MSVYERLLQAASEKGAGYLVLLDPDKNDENGLRRAAEQAQESGADALLVGGSLLLTPGFQAAVRAVRSVARVPVIIFPGSTHQVCAEADAILFLSLISGRNPMHLIGLQVIAAPLIKAMGIEAIGTGYILVESGRMTSAEFMSDTRPIPREKPDIAKAHALAAEYLGMKLVYLEAGSGAQYPVPDEMVKAVAEYVTVPVVVGGGIRTPEEAHRKARAGARFVVIGNVLEDRGSPQLLREFADAIHWRSPVGA
ncbi:MAG: geranylgeranylglyceryl/heptaprenylglyceryl phosphate synthase [candidate division KSB1 bacterium]|nr:geranylgeranylglyceryl/heptaprenylglyceryl phosphate synthase [candidate division KSB1 bacterium]